MTEREQFISEHLRLIRSYAIVLNENNWRDIQLRIRIEFDAVKALADGEIEDRK